MTILVTGAAGFIGFHVSRALMARGEAVFGLDSLNSYYSPQLKEHRLATLKTEFGQAFRFAKVDIADEAAVAAAVAGTDIDRIVHLAAQPGVRYSMENPLAYVRSNVVGHAVMLEVARSRQVSHFVYASSSSVYGGNKSLPFREEDRVDHPVSLYAATKKSDELMSETYAHLYRLPQTGLRFFTVYGPYGRPDMAVWLFTQAILESRPITVYGSDTRRDFTYIDDIVDGVLAALDRPPSGKGAEKTSGGSALHNVYNLGNSRSEKVQRLIEVIEDACGRRAVRRAQSLPPGDVPDTFADVTAARIDLRFVPKTKIAEGIPRFVAWYRSYRQNQ